MANVAKYLLVLETLKLSEEDTDEHVIYNLNTLKKSIKLDLKVIVEEINEQLKLQHLLTEQIVSEAVEDNKAIYVIYLQYLLLQITKNTNFSSDAKEDLIATRHLNLCIAAVQHISALALLKQLHPCLCQTGVFGRKTDHAFELKHTLLGFSVEFFAHTIKINQFHSANSMDTVIREYMSAIFTLLITGGPNYELVWQSLRLKLNYIWQSVSKVAYFRNILLIKSIPHLPKVVIKHLHQELLLKLTADDGFTTLVATLQFSNRSCNENKRPDEKQVFESVAKIVSASAHTPCFQRNMIRQILKFLKLCLYNKAMVDSMGAGLLSLRRLFDLNLENQTLVREILHSSINELCDPTDVISGLILMENHDFCMLLSWYYHLFCTSAVECLPSSLLVDYLPLLLEIYQQLHITFKPKQQLASLILRCLHNRSETELPLIIEALYTMKYKSTWKRLHERIILIPNNEESEVVVKIAPLNFKNDLSISMALPEILLSMEHHLLSYRIFMILLRILSSSALSDFENQSTERVIDLLQTNEEVIDFLNENYPIKAELLLSLNALIAHEPLRAQIAANANEFMEFLRNLLDKRTQLQHSERNTELGDQTLLLLLTLTQEMLEQSQLPDIFNNFIPTLTKLYAQSSNQLVQQCAKELITLLNSDPKANAKHYTASFFAARKLMESSESHLQVYGIKLFEDLLRERDSTTLAQKHVVIALALSTLRKPESYTFLNCVRLFVAMVNVVEIKETVLDILVDEYLTESAQMDFRLVVGETILRVCKELGPMCFQHKNLLINCFMQGARSNNNEFRMSAFANLAQMCGILSFQVQHFIQELLNLIDCELTASAYAPSKRAALLVLNELLTGMENLRDYEEMLLPVYRLLKTIESDGRCDSKMRLHAANGLKILADKCLKFIFPAQDKIQKEIKILHINEQAETKKTKPHIFELN